MSPSETSIRGFPDTRSRRPSKSHQNPDPLPGPRAREARAEPMKPAPPVIRITWVRAARKPNSVPRRGCPRRGDGHASSPAVSRRVERPTRKLGQAALGRFPIWSCSMRGLPCPGHRCPGGALLPHLFTLTAPRRERRFVFCGTFLPVTRTGGYPAHCLVEFGLSSRSRRSRRPSERLEPPGILSARKARLPETLRQFPGFDAETAGGPFPVPAAGSEPLLHEPALLGGQVIGEPPGFPRLRGA